MHRLQGQERLREPWQVAMHRSQGQERLRADWLVLVVQLWEMARLVHQR